MLISDWSSDVCSSDLSARRTPDQPRCSRRRDCAQHLQAFVRRGASYVRRNVRCTRPAVRRPLFDGSGPHYRLDQPMLRTLVARRDAFPLRTPFRISRGVKTVADVVTVEISADGATGRGEVVPCPRYGGLVEGAM